MALSEVPWLPTSPRLTRSLGLHSRPPVEPGLLRRGESTLPLEFIQAVSEWFTWPWGALYILGVIDKWPSLSLKIGGGWVKLGKLLFFDHVPLVGLGWRSWPMKGRLSPTYECLLAWAWVYLLIVLHRWLILLYVLLHLTYWPWRHAWNFVGRAGLLEPKGACLDLLLISLTCVYCHWLLLTVYVECHVGLGWDACITLHIPSTNLKYFNPLHCLVEKPNQTAVWPNRVLTYAKVLILAINSMTPSHNFLCFMHQEHFIYMLNIFSIRN